MKTTVQILSLTGLVLGSLAVSLEAAAQYDDIYYNPKDKSAQVEETAVVKDNNKRDKSDYEKYIESL
jgi:hypothetical protein